MSDAQFLCEFGPVDSRRARNNLILLGADSGFPSVRTNTIHYTRNYLYSVRTSGSCQCCCDVSGTLLVGVQRAYVCSV